MTEILVVLVLTLVVVGPERLPEIARMIGKGLREIRRATNLFRDTMMVDEDLDVDVLDQPASSGPVDMTGDQPEPATSTDSVPRSRGPNRTSRTRLEAAPIQDAHHDRDVRRISLPACESTEALRQAYLPMPHRQITRPDATGEPAPSG